MRHRLPKNLSGLEAFAMIVDINGFTLLVNSYQDSIAQLTSNLLIGGVECVEEHGGHVVGLMGDAFYALLPDPMAVFETVIGIAVDVNKQCEYFDHLHSEFKKPGYPKGFGVKIGIEHGWIDVAEIETTDMGPQRLFVGEAVIYAHRISSAGKGNRCLVGPAAAQLLEKCCHLKGPHKIKGKKGEPLYTYFQMDLREIWLEGLPVDGQWYVD